MSPDEWDACSWDVQRMYAEGMLGDGLYHVDEPAGESDGDGFSHRTVDIGGDVIDLQEMIRSSKEAQAARQAG
jgi:hypothetical protein